MSSHDPNRSPTADELAGMAWWNNLSEPARAEALKAAGWTASGAATPSVAEAWAHFKKTSPSYRNPN